MWTLSTKVVLFPRSHKYGVGMVRIPGGNPCVFKRREVPVSVSSKTVGLPSTDCFSISLYNDSRILHTRLVTLIDDVVGRVER